MQVGLFNLTLMVFRRRRQNLSIYGPAGRVTNRENKSIVSGPKMASHPKQSSSSIETHLGKVNARAKNLKKLEGWPQHGDFLTGRESLISQLVTDLSDTDNLEEYYMVLKKYTQVIGNQLQEVYARKTASKFFHLHLGKSDAMPCPDPQLHYFMRITYENVIGVYAERVSDHLSLKKRKIFPLALLDVYLHEMRIIDQDVVDIPASSAMLQYLEQWGNNAWPQALRASDIVPRSWTHCVAKMKQILALEWKPAPELTVINEDGTSRQVEDDSKSLSSFVAHRSFFLALYLYCVIHPQFFASNFEALIGKTKESVFGELLVEWANKRVGEMKASETTTKKTQSSDSASSITD
jgi:hypothetical protein